MAEKGLKRYTHDDLRKWGELLDAESPQGLGEKLLCYADDWRVEIETREAGITQVINQCIGRMTVLEEQLLKLRQIASYVPVAVWAVAKQSAGHGEMSEKDWRELMGKETKDGAESL